VTADSWDWRKRAAILRRPALIVGEVLGIAVASAAAASFPQGIQAPEFQRLAASSPLLAQVLAALGFVDILSSSWFLGLVALSMASLTVVQLDQWSRLRRVWSAEVNGTSFARAPFRKDLPLPSRRPAPEAPLYSRSGRIGLLGSPLFHLGLLVLVLAGLLRSLTFSGAAARILEGDVLPADPSAWQLQRGGRLSSPFSLGQPLRLDRVRSERYPSGTLRQVTAEVSLLGAGEPARAEIAINSPLELGSNSVYVLQMHGLAAVVLRQTPRGEERKLISLTASGSDLRGGARLEDGRELRARVALQSETPRAVELRVSDGPALLAVSTLAAGGAMSTGPDESFLLERLAYWIDLRGERDVSIPVFFAGLVLAIVGAALMFGVVQVETGVFVQGGRLVVALRAHRFAPLFSERFEALCKEWSE
jgi:hypothetical protein